MVNVATIRAVDAEQAIVPLLSRTVANRATSGFSQENFLSRMIANLSVSTKLRSDEVVNRAGGNNAISRYGFGDKALPGARPTAMDNAGNTPQQSAEGEDANAAAAELVANAGIAPPKVSSSPQHANIEKTPLNAVPTISREASGPDRADAQLKHALEAVNASKTNHDARPAQTKSETKNHKTQAPNSTGVKSIPADPLLAAGATAPADETKSLLLTQPAVQRAAPLEEQDSSEDLKIAAASTPTLLGGGLMVQAHKKSQRVKTSISRTISVNFEDDGSRGESCRSTERASSFGEAVNPHLRDLTEKPYRAASEISGEPPLVKVQSCVVVESSADMRPSVSGYGHVAGEYVEAKTVNVLARSESAHRMLATTPTMLEIGVPGGSHGWLKIRAELAGDGAVHASVSTTSSTGEEILRRQLPALETYLHQERVSVGSLVVHAGAAPQQSSHMAGEVDFSGMGCQQQGDRQKNTGQQETTSFREWSEGLRSGGTDDEGADWLPQVEYAGNGGWLSVRA